MHICHIYLSCFSVPYLPVVGTLGKFPNQHLFWSKVYFSIVKLWATIEILISAQLSIKSIFSNIIGIGYLWNLTFGHVLCSILHLVFSPHCLAHWLSKPWHFTKFHLLPCLVQQFTFSILPNGKFPLFPSLFGTLAIKAMAFHEILPFAPFCAVVYILCIVKWEISTISLTVWHVGHKSHGILQNFAIFPPKCAIS